MTTPLQMMIRYLKLRLSSQSDYDKEEPPSSAVLMLPLQIRNNLVI